MLALDLYWRGPGWPGRARHDVLGPDRVRCGVEINEISGPHVDRADAKSHAVGIDAIKIDQSLECRLERIGIVSAGGLNGSGRMQPWRRKSRREESWRATDESEIGAHLVQPLPHCIALRRKR